VRASIGLHLTLLAVLLCHYRSPRATWRSQWWVDLNPAVPSGYLHLMKSWEWVAISFEDLEWTAERFDEQQPSNVWLSHVHRHSGSSVGTVFCDFTAFSLFNYYYSVRKSASFHRTWSKPWAENYLLEHSEYSELRVLN
jgi:hypothetical protein